MLGVGLGGVATPAVGVWSRMSSQVQIPAFWQTFRQKINACESAEYHTFPFQTVLHAPSMG